MPPKVMLCYEQNRTEQNRTEQNRTEQNRTEQNRTEQNRIFISLKLLQFLATLHTNTTIYKMLVTKQGIITMDKVCVKI